MDALLSDKETATYGNVQENMFERKQLQRVTTTFTPPFNFDDPDMQRLPDHHLCHYGRGSDFNWSKYNVKENDHNDCPVALDYSSDLDGSYENVPPTSAISREVVTRNQFVTGSESDNACYSNPKRYNEIPKLRHQFESVDVKENIPKLRSCEGITTKFTSSNHLQKPKQSINFHKDQSSDAPQINDCTFKKSAINSPLCTDFLDNSAKFEENYFGTYDQPKLGEYWVEAFDPNKFEEVGSYSSRGKCNFKEDFENNGKYIYEDSSSRPKLLRRGIDDINLHNEPNDIEGIIKNLSGNLKVSNVDPGHGNKHLPDLGGVCHSPELLNSRENIDAAVHPEKELESSFQMISRFPQSSEVFEVTPHKSGIPNANSGDSNSHKSIMYVPKGNCGACNEAIVGQVLMALGQMWHLDHFRCAHCNVELGMNIFYEKDGRAYCEQDYIFIFSPRCAACDEPILEKCITALNKSWHPHHFSCSYCKELFDKDGYHEMDGLPYCSRDFYNLFAPKCFGCGDAITGNYYTALHQQWHPQCFVCFECREPFASGSFYDHDGRPFCESHFNILKKGLCASCNHMILGPSVVAIGKKYHPSHFVCTFCLQIIYQGTFKEHESKPYCHQCSDKLFG